MSMMEIIDLVSISVSAPVTRAPSLKPSRATSPLRAATKSAPSSPRSKTSRWNVVKKHHQAQTHGSSAWLAPLDAIRKQTPSASFGKAPLMRTMSVPSLCPKHAYAGPVSSFKGTHASFATDKRERRASKETNGPAVHSYADAFSSFKGTHASFATDKSERRPSMETNGPAVHSYADPTSSFKATHASFATDKRERRPSMETDGPAVHAYISGYSSLKRTGSGVFGSTAPRSAATAVSRTGLYLAPATPVLAPQQKLRKAPSTPLLALAKGQTRVRSRLEAALRSGKENHTPGATSTAPRIVELEAH